MKTAVCTKTTIGRCSTTSKQRLCKEGSVNANRLSICRERFPKGSVYKMSGFDVTQNFRLSDAPSPYLLESVKQIPNDFFLIPYVRPVTYTGEHQQTTT
ncbi:hypothetical protein IGI04_023910, partial [Brassica rapa subsp. trilocularis]